MSEQPDRPSAVGIDAELSHLRERLAFYDSFDQVIRENVSQLSSLLRKAAETEEEARRAIENAEVQRDIAKKADRSHFRTLFSTMLDEVTALQGQVERLARRVADSLDDLESDHSLTETSVAGPIVAELGPGDVVVTPPEAPETETVAPGVTPEDLDASSPSDRDLEGIAPFSADDYVQGERVVETSELPLPSRPEAEPETAVEPEAVGATVLVHGVPRATTALSLKRFLENLPSVDHVEPREYAEGVLRLLVTSQRPVTMDDLLSWTEGASLEPVNIRAGLIEVRLRS